LSGGDCVVALVSLVRMVRVVMWALRYRGLKHIDLIETLRHCLLFHSVT
jgi:hypothetical protein